MGILDGKGVVVTGAGRGIGRGHCLHAAANGASVVVNDVDGDEAKKVVDEIAAALFERPTQVGECARESRAPNRDPAVGVLGDV